MLFLSFIFLLLSSSAFAQNLTVPASWTGTTTNRTRDERVLLAQNACLDANQRMNSSANPWEFWQMGPVLISMAMTDYIAGTKENEQMVTEQVINNISKNPVAFMSKDTNGALDILLYWAEIAVYGYRAYGNQQLLEAAERAWDQFSVYQVSKQEADAGKSDKPDIEIVSQCNQSSTAGVVFWREQGLANEGSTVSTGNFLLLSAHLANLTSNDTYTSAAVLSAEFVATQLRNSAGIVYDTVSLNKTSGTCSQGTAVWASNTGLLIEAFAVLAAPSKNNTWMDLAVQSLDAATHGARWNSATGVNIELVENGYKAHLLRHMYELWKRNSDPAVKYLIESYITVQHNSMLTNAATKDGNFTTYSFDWTGPAPQKWSIDGASAALDLLGAGIIAGSTPDPKGGSDSGSAITSGSQPSQTGEPPSPKPKSSPAVAIGLGVGIPIVLLLALGAFLCLRRRRRRQAQMVVPTTEHDFMLARSDAPPAIIAAPARAPPARAPEKRYVPSAPDGSEHSGPAGSSDRSGPASVSVTSPTRSGAPMDQDLSVPELVRLLNERLRGNQQPDPAVSGLGAAGAGAPAGPPGLGPPPPIAPGEDEDDGAALPPPAYEGNAGGPPPAHPRGPGAGRRPRRRDEKSTSK